MASGMAYCAPGKVGISDLSTRSLSGVGIASVLYLALMATLAAYTLWTRLLKALPRRVMPFSMLRQVGRPVGPGVIFGMRPSPVQRAGTVAPAGQVADQPVGRKPRGRL